MTRHIELLRLLKRNPKRGVTSARASAYLGIRNVPDAILKLRRKGHNIETTLGPAKFDGKQYVNIATYRYAGREQDRKIAKEAVAFLKTYAKPFIEKISEAKDFEKCLK